MDYTLAEAIVTRRVNARCKRQILLAANLNKVRQTARSDSLLKNLIKSELRKRSLNAFGRFLKAVFLEYSNLYSLRKVSLVKLADASNMIWESLSNKEKVIFY